MDEAWWLNEAELWERKAQAFLDEHPEESGSTYLGYLEARADACRFFAAEAPLRERDLRLSPGEDFETAKQEA